MNFLSSGLRIAAFDRTAAARAAREPGYLAPAVLSFSAGGMGLSVAFYIAFTAGQEEPLGKAAAVAVVLAFMIAGPLLHLAGWYVLARASHAIAVRRFGGKGDFRGYYSALGTAAFLTWVPTLWLASVLTGIYKLIMVLAVLANIAEVWFLIAAVYATSGVLGIPLKRAAAAVLIPVAVALIPLVALWMTI